jgi:hypothetical protein
MPGGSKLRPLAAAAAAAAATRLELRISQQLQPSHPSISTSLFFLALSALQFPNGLVPKVEAIQNNRAVFAYVQFGT